MSATTLDLRVVDAPDDAPPSTEPPIEPKGSSTDFDPLYPGSTPDAPYGFFDDGRPRKRRPRGTGTTTTSSKGGRAANENLASSAAAMLTQINSLVGMSMSVFGMPKTARDLEAANAQFQTMATESLRTDPVLCRKILSAGATSGRTGLLIAYIYLAGSAFPSAREEIREARERKALENADAID